MQTVYRTKRVKHTVKRITAESVNTFSPIFVGQAWRSLGAGSGTGVSGIVGSGSPQGVVSAPPGTLYKDSTITGGGVWIKVTGSGNTGWDQVIA